jgi:hypothetical protein
MVSLPKVGKMMEYKNKQINEKNNWKGHIILKEGKLNVSCQ